jgi:hypothetical protein
MKRIAIIVPMLLAAADASAISRYEISNMSCAKVQSLVRSEGAVILRYRSARDPSLPLYERYVLDGRYCGPAQVATRVGVPTADTDYCPVHRCFEKKHLRFRRR